MHSGDSSAECGESQPTEVKQDVSEMENKEITVVGGIPGRRQRKHNSGWLGPYYGFRPLLLPFASSAAKIIQFV